MNKQEQLQKLYEIDALKISTILFDLYKCDKKNFTKIKKI